MALTKADESVSAARVKQANFVVTLTVDLDDSYPQATGGYDLSDLLDGLPNSYTLLDVRVQETATHFFTYEAGKLRVWVKGAPDAEAADEADLAAITGLLFTCICE